MVPSLTDVSSERLKVRPVAGLPLVHVEAPRALHASHWAKRAFDVLGSLGILLLISPVWLATALAIKLHDGGPVLFRQTRIGRDGRPFSCLKFRSMVIDAEQLRADLEVNHERSAVLFKMADDPRVTRPGRLIRRLSIDELPQLWNVLRGQMSLVGPRPPLPHEAARYGSDMSRRLRVRPGMTGLWQVSGRSDLSWDETVRLDLYYVDNWSMVQDLTILARTVSAVLSSPRGLLSRPSLRSSSGSRARLETCGASRALASRREGRRRVEPRSTSEAMRPGRMSGVRLRRPVAGPVRLHGQHLAVAVPRAAGPVAEPATRRSTSPAPGCTRATTR